MSSGVVIFVLFAAALPGWIAQRKGHGFWAYWMLGVLLLIVALPYTLWFLKDQRLRCPYCAEPVRFEALRCRHCQGDLRTSVNAPTSA